jgi:8-oxo-dGTP pyrophosphatase MutT (NUDIX family)
MMPRGDLLYHRCGVDDGYDALRKLTRHRQCGAIPTRVVDGELHVLLVTSRGRGRWIIPKGWPSKTLSCAAAAAREAFEEAGVVGDIGAAPIGSFPFEKLLGSGESIACEVQVFVLEVERQLADWPERGQRMTRWVGIDEAVRLVDDPGLAVILRGLDRPRRIARPARAGSRVGA